MPIQIVLAPPASGKTQYAVDQIRALLKQQQLQKIWVVVPERRQADAFRARLIAGGGMLGVSIGTFDNLCSELLLFSGQHQALAPQPLLHRVLRESLQTLAAQNSLGIFDTLRNMSGFSGLLHQHFHELQQAGVDPLDPALEPWKNSGENYRVLLTCYTTTLQRLDRMQWRDPAGLAEHTRTLLTHHQLVATNWDLLVVDGFERFTPPQHAILTLLGQVLPRVLITLSAVPGSTRPVHQRSLNTLAIFQANNPNLEILCLPQRTHLPPTLTRLEQYFLEQPPAVSPCTADFHMLAVQSPAQEVREALRWIKRLIVEHKAAPADCAIFIPGAEPYPALLRATAREFGLRLHFSQGESLADHPAMRTLLDLLNLESSNYARRTLIDLLRSPYLDLGSLGWQPQDPVSLEMVSRYGPVISGLKNWQKALLRLALLTEGALDPSEETEAENHYALPQGTQAQRLSAALQALADHLHPVQPSQTLAAWVAWLDNLLNVLRWPAQVQRAAQSPVLDKLKNVLQGLRLGDLELGAWEMDYAQFVHELDGLLRITPQEIPLPKDREHIPVLRIIEARGVRFAWSAILGLAEGSFPRVERADPFFSEAFRAQFGLELHLEQDQAGVFYQALTRAEQGLLCTRSYLSANGEALEASPYWNALLEICGERTVETIRPGTRRGLTEAASAEEFFFWAQVHAQTPNLENFPHLQTALATLHERQAVLRARLERTPNGIFEGQFQLMPTPLEALQKETTIWSPSRLETYLACPLRFWTQHGLGVEEQTIPQPGLQAHQLGSLLHQILEEAYPAAENPELPESVLQALPETAARVFADAPQRYQFEPNAMWTFQQEEWLKALQTAIVELGQGGWMPLAHEAKFGLDGNPPLEITLAGGRKLRIRGVIDRLDRNVQGELRVVDYKTGSGHQSADDLMNGTRLQLPLYAQAAEQALGLGEVVEGFYWALLVQKAGSLKLSSFTNGDFSGLPGAAQVVHQHLQAVVDGIQAADFRPQVPQGGCPAYCPARLWCWRYQPERR
jgi:ATP-dependent helicase/DNAse subunit B